MKRFLWVLASGVTVLGTAAVWAADLQAADIAARNVAARGGLQAWRAVGSIRMAGEMDAGGKQGAHLPFVWSLKRPHKSRLEIVFQDQTAVQAYDGSQGWKLRPFLNRDAAEPFTPAEARSAAAAAELDGPLVDYVRKGSKLELLGKEEVEGKPAYKLHLTPKTGPAFNLWVDATTFLESKIDGEPRKLDGRLHKVAIYYRDYRTVDGLTLAHTLETAVEGVAPSHKITLQSVKINPALPDILFALRAPATPTSQN
jgi:outer membrane lipoprotein-sorting protein